MLAYSDSSYRQNDKDCMDIIIHYEDTETPLSCFSPPKHPISLFPPKRVSKNHTFFTFKKRFNEILTEPARNPPSSVGGGMNCSKSQKESDTGNKMYGKIKRTLVLNMLR